MTSLFVFGLILVILLIVAGFCMSRMPGRSFSGALPPLTGTERHLRDRLQTHVETLAGNIGERNIWRHDKLEQAAAYIEEAFAHAGLNVRSLYHESAGQPVRNLEAELPGSRTGSGVLVVGAHYDSLLHTAGANDNGSGVAALLELARLLADSNLSTTLRFVAFVNEEPPFFKTSRMGSWIYAQQAQARGEHLIGMISLETLGYYTDEPLSQAFPLPLLRFFYPDQGNFLALVGNLTSSTMLKRSVRAFRQSADFPSEGIVAPGWLPGVDWSDHWSFWKVGCPAIMVTDTALFRYPYYHGADDTPGKINYYAMARVVAGLQGMIVELGE